jgi:hypothetical protein
MMHLLYENIPGYMFKHWYGNFFANDLEKNEEYILPKRTWDMIGQQMENARKTMPTDFGRPPRNIAAHRDGYKAEEWANWVALYSLPLLKPHLPRSILKGWKYFVDAVRLCQKNIIEKEDLNEIRKLILAFYKYYEM